MRKLLDAGAEVFASRGYHAARVDDIVKVANTSHGTFYLYFANKEDLFRALAVEVGDQMQELARSLPAVPAGKQGRAVLRGWLEQFTALYERSAPVLRAWTEAEIAGDEVGRIGEDLLGAFSLVISERLREADGEHANPAVAAIALLAMIERLNYYVLTDQVAVSRDAMLDTLAAVTHAAMWGAPHR